MDQVKTAKWGGDTSSPETPYHKAGKVWDERMGDARRQAHNWRLAAFFCMFISLVSVGGMIYLGQLPKTEVEVIEIDELGNSVYLGRAGQSMENWRPSEKQIEFHLRSFLRMTRSLSSDMMVVKQSWNDAYNYLANEAVNQLNSETRQLTPFKRMETQTVSISIEDVLRLSPDTWQVDWSEQIWSKNGEILAKESWRGTFKIEIKVPDTKEKLQKNPIGMYVTHYSWTKVFR